jgi:NAD(P)H-dependent FMN reductase
MKLTVINGSPRGQKSSTTRLMTPLMKGFDSVPGGESEMIYLNHKLGEEKLAEIWQTSDVIFLAFPLYVDAMPGQVKGFIESLQVFKGSRHPPVLAFFVHSGFPEAIHSRFVERYLAKLSIRLGCPHAGTIVKGGSEGMQLMPDKSIQPLLSKMEMLGVALGKTKLLEAQLVKEIAGMERIPRFMGLFFPLLAKFGVFDGYWNSQLKANNAYHDRFARPYQSD